MYSHSESFKKNHYSSVENRINSYGLVIIVGIFSSILALSLLLNFYSAFYYDWYNHLWMVEYSGEYIKQHLTPPVMFNTKQLIGMPMTLFYAQKFYALSGILSAFLGSVITIRIMAFVVFLLQFFHVYHAAIKAGSAKNTSICIAVIVTWAIYPLTNLYNRSALTEFFAVAFLTCALASFLCVIINSREHASRYDIIAMGLFFVAAAITHPLTALFGGLFLGVLGLIALLFCERSRKLWFMAYFSITAFFSSLILSPWIYLIYKFNSKLPISAANAIVGFEAGAFCENIDNIWSRLSPFPLDLRSIKSGVQDVSTPYLDAQIVLPLVILIAVFVCLRLREKNISFRLSVSEWAITWGSAIIMFFAFAISVHPEISGWLGGFFNILQLPYRLTSYVNLSSLVVVIILAGRTSVTNANSKQIINVCLGFCIAISLSALMLKLVHASAIAISQKSINVVEKISWIDGGMKHEKLLFRSNGNLNELPVTLDGEKYSIEDGFAQPPLPSATSSIHQKFDVLDGARFGQVAPLTIELKKPALVITNVQPFPWNQMVIDDVPQAQSNVIVAEGREAVLLSKGKHILKVITLNDSVWKCLNILSWILLILWITLYTILLLFSLGKLVRNSRVYSPKKEHS